jgi:hypothetical protein
VEQSPFLRRWQLFSCLRHFQPFMEPKGSPPCSQEDVTGSYPDTHESSLYLILYCLSIHCNIILATIPRISTWTLFLKACKRIYYVSISCLLAYHMDHLSPLPLFYYRNNIWRLYVMKLLIMQYPIFLVNVLQSSFNYCTCDYYDGESKNTFDCFIACLKEVTEEHHFKI